MPHWTATGRSNVKELQNQVKLELQPVQDIHLKSAHIYDTASRGDIRFVWLFGIIAVFVLLLARSSLRKLIRILRGSLGGMGR